MWLLIEGGSYSRVAFINIGVIPLGDIDTVDSFFRTDYHIYNYTQYGWEGLGGLGMGCQW